MVNKKTAFDFPCSTWYHNNDFTQTLQMTCGYVFFSMIHTSLYVYIKFKIKYIWGNLRIGAFFLNGLNYWVDRFSISGFKFKTKRINIMCVFFFLIPNYVRMNNIVSVLLIWDRSRSYTLSIYFQVYRNS